MSPPSGLHLFGTDALGRDILSRVVVAARLDLGMAISAVVLSFALGLGLGAIAGYFGGWADRIIGRLMDTIMAFPLFVLAMGIVAALGNSVLNIILATMIINLPFYCRFARGEVNVRREMGYVEAARMGGNRALPVLVNHIIPNILPAMMVQASLNMGWAILNAAGLSFIGLGVRPPTPEWGIMVSEGASFIISGEWWTFVFPGAALVLAVFCFNLLGDGLRDLLDPRRRV
jgi:peptide/nickel transport system permease protein